MNRKQNKSEVTPTFFMPEAEESGFIKTLNQMGYMTSSLDPFSQKFVNFAGEHNDEEVLEIGAAYGIATLAALEKGARIVANDLDEKHLEILFHRVAVDKQFQLKLKHGSLPDELEFESNRFAGILISRVLHFFEGDEIEKSVRLFHDWLRPGGKVFAVTETPYIKPFKDLIPEYEKRKAAGEKWPGVIRNVRELVKHRAQDIPSFFHPLDIETISYAFKNAGFEIEEVAYINRAEFAEEIRLDGREGVGIIAVKPDKRD